MVTEMAEEDQVSKQWGFGMKIPMSGTERSGVGVDYAFAWRW